MKEKTEIGIKDKGIKAVVALFSQILAFNILS